MAELALRDFQYELGGLVIGTGTPYPVRKVDGLGRATDKTEDEQLAYDDGEMPGEDRLAGRDVSFEGGVKLPGDPAAAMAAHEELAAAWENEDVRLNPGEVMPLRIRLPGRPTRRLYGRPRSYDPDLSQLIIGWIPFVLRFRATDPRFYGDEPASVTLGLDVSATSGGIAFPLVFPITSTARSPLERPGWVRLGGTARTWPVVTFTGPSVNPGVRNQLTGQVLQLNLTLGAGETLTIDCRPGRRTVRRGGASVVGALGADSRMDRFWINPGGAEFAYFAADATNTSRCAILAEPAYKSA